jgi:hypothetical protein
MRSLRSLLGRLIATGILLGTFSVAGCSDPEAGSAPKMKGTKDEIQKELAPPAPSKTGAPKKK